MDAASQVLTGEDGDDPPHFAVGQVAAGLGHSHVGRKINIPHKKVRNKSTLLSFRARCVRALSAAAAGA